MDQSLRLLQSDDGRTDGLKWEGPDRDIPVTDSVTLMSGKRELVIRHNGQAYRLRVTTSDKLILTK